MYVYMSMCIIYIYNTYIYVYLHILYICIIKQNGYHGCLLTDSYTYVHSESSDRYYWTWNLPIRSMNFPALLHIHALDVDGTKNNYSMSSELVCPGTLLFPCLNKAMIVSGKYMPLLGFLSLWKFVGSLNVSPHFRYLNTAASTCWVMMWVKQ